MSTDESGTRDSALRALRAKMSEIEAKSEGLEDAAAAARHRIREAGSDPDPAARWTGANYPGMPEGDDWLDVLPPRYQDGVRGFELRLARELAAVGVRCYTLQDLRKYPRTDRQAIPVFVDWLTNLDAKIPGPETLHRDGIRTLLLRNLTDSAVQGDSSAIAAVIAQLRRQPPLNGGTQWTAGIALDRIARPDDYSEILELFGQLTADEARAALLPYLGRSKSREAIQIAIDELANPGTRQWAIQALILAEADGTRPLIARYANDENEQVRRWVKTAMKQLE